MCGFTQHLKIEVVFGFKFLWTVEMVRFCTAKINFKVDLVLFLRVKRVKKDANNG